MADDKTVDDTPKGDTILTGDDKNSDVKSDDDAGKKDDDAGKKDDDAGKDDADHKADDKSKDSDADKDKDGAPDTYDIFVVPDGMEIDPDTLKEALPLMRAANLTQDQAQRFVDLQSKITKQVTDAHLKAWTDQQSKWRETAENDEEYGKGKYDESILIARKGMRVVGSPALMKALEETGMGNHPEFIRFFFNVGKAVGEDNLSFGTGNKEGAKTLAERIFPNQNQS